MHQGTRVPALLAVGILALASNLLALAPRTFVSAQHGSDANPCSVTSPCRTFGAAIAGVATGGEVVALDSGGYGAVTITQAVTIEAPAGIYAGISVASGDAIDVNAPGATVTLRGLVLNGGPGHGISVQAVGTLNVESCSITGFSTSNHAGIGMGAPGYLNIKNTDLKACYIGLAVVNSSGTVITSIDRSHLDGNTIGGAAFSSTIPGATKTTATNSTANNNADKGWTAGGNASGNDFLTLESCTASGNASDGLRAETATVRYSNCVFSNNGGYGIYNNGAATLESRGNNTITANESGPTFGTGP